MQHAHCFSRIGDQQSVSWLAKLNQVLYVQYQALEVFAFGVIYVDRVIGRLGELVEYAHLAAALCGSAEYRKAELLFVYSL